MYGEQLLSESVGELAAYCVRHPAETASQRALDLARQGLVAMDRGGSRLHFTASAILLSADRRRICMVWHERLQRWLQPGGHIEPLVDRTIEAAARRELVEETGISDFRLALAHAIDFDAHPIPRSDACLEHFDFRFLYVCRGPHDVARVGTTWRAFDELQELDPSISRFADKTMRLAQAPNGHPASSALSAPTIPVA